MSEPDAWTRLRRLLLAEGWSWDSELPVGLKSPGGTCAVTPSMVNTREMRAELVKYFGLHSRGRGDKDPDLLFLIRSVESLDAE